MMINTLQSGANISLNHLENIEIELLYSPNHFVMNIAAFLLNNSDKVRSDNDFIYLHDNVEIQSEYVTLSLRSGHPIFRINLAKITPDIQKIVFVIASKDSLNHLQNIQIKIGDLAIFNPENTGLCSLLLGELYFKNQQWKFRALGQGYQQDLSFLANRFGTQFNPQTQTDSVSNQTNHRFVSSNTDQVMATLRQEIPSVQTIINPDNVKEGILAIKSFSWQWMLTSLVIFIILEIVISSLFFVNSFWSFAPQSFRYLVEIVSFLITFLLGGTIVGLISPSIRVIEPALAAFFSVFIMLSNGFFTPYGFSNFSLVKTVIGGGIAFAFAMSGARLGEKIAAKFGNKTSQNYFNRRNRN